MSLRAFRVDLDTACAFVARHHRHHAAPAGHRFSLGVGSDVLHGVAMVGRPVARGIDGDHVAEVTRLCTDGTRNTCSWLYTAAARVAREMGFMAVITYTLAAEDGASLRACGWWPEVLDERGTAWGCEARPRTLTKGQGLGQKVRWLWLTGNAPSFVAPVVEDSRQFQMFGGS
jgi:hypothetical protein